MLADELTALDAVELNPTSGGVGFKGPFRLCCRVNLESRVAGRVLWRVGQGVYHQEQDLYDAAYALPWGDWFTADRTIKVGVSAQRCPLQSLEFVTLRLKDAVCDRFRARSGRRPSVDRRRPDVRIEVFLKEQTYAVYLDTSGEPLFKRGFRASGGEAPLRENLAAGILKLAGWPAAAVLLDPMCGSGTVLVEAALMAADVAPGLGRSFAFERLIGFEAARWRRVCEEARARRRAAGEIRIFGSDHAPEAIKAARANLEAAGMANSVRLDQVEVSHCRPPASSGILVANPPYGVRVGDERELARFYPRLGDALKQRFPGWRAFLFTGDVRLPNLIGLRPARRIPLFNGPLECRLYEFPLVQGTMRREKTGAEAT